MQMDREGFYPQHSCRVCEHPLNADGGHPAELYAGTYTGLCYGCQNAPVYVVHTSSLDGCRLLSYAPHCPSWRRDREEYFAYQDCETCRGTGRLYVSRSCGEGGSYYRHCPDCMTRFGRHPVRQWHDARLSRLGSAASHGYERGTARLLRVKRVTKSVMAKIDANQKAQLAELAGFYQDRWRIAVARQLGAYGHRQRCE